MAATFHKFPDLPPELRLLVWEEALLEARDTRTVVLYDDRVMPFKHLISPLLSVNQESRVCAQAFYHVKLDVYAVSPGVIDTFVPLGGTEIQGDGTVVYDKMSIEDIKERCRAAGRSAVEDAEETKWKAGMIYISPEQDRLIMGFDCGLHFCMEQKMMLMAQEQPGSEDLACHHISAELPAAACQEVSSLIVQIWRLRSPRTAFYNVWDVDCEWEMDRYPNLLCHYTVSLDEITYDSFLSKIVESGGKLPFKTENWVWQHHPLGDGMPILVNEQEWAAGQDGRWEASVSPERVNRSLLS